MDQEWTDFNLASAIKPFFAEIMQLIPLQANAHVS
jgi:hypothetical protein